MEKRQSKNPRSGAARGLAAAIVLLIIVVPFAVFFSTGSPAAAADPNVLPMHGPESHHVFLIASEQSENWGGYVAATSFTSPAATVTAVYGSWIVQAVQPSTVATYSSQWIGIGGYFSGDGSLIQTGTGSDSAGDVNSYYAWYELLPASETVIPTLTVNPGDKVSASILCTASCTSSTQTWTISITDSTTGKSFTDSGVSYSSSLSSADWIEERPCIADSCLSVSDLATLANFGTAYYGFDYTSVASTNYATVGGTTSSLGALPNTAITMVSSTDSILASSSSLTTDGTSFTMTYGGTSTSSTSTSSSSSSSSTTKSTSSSTSVSTSTSTSSSLALDGSASTGCGYVTSCSVKLTTAHGSDVIIVGCDCFPVSVASTFSVTDTAGLTFTARAVIGIGGNQFLKEWYAIAPGSLSSDTISVTTTDTGETWYGVVAFGVSGANTANPFDSNPSLPAAQANNANCKGSGPCDTGVSTSNANDFVFQVGGDTGSALQTAGAGMTLILSSKSGQNHYAQYEILSGTTLSSAKLAFGTSQGSDFGVIADAIQAGSTTTTSSTSSSSTTSSTKSSSTTSSSTITSSSTSSTTKSTSSSSSSSTTSSTTSSSTTAPGLALDGSASKGCGYVTSCSVTLSTSSSSPDVIVVGCDCFPIKTTFSVKDTAGLTFTARTGQITIGGNQFLQEWYAIAPSKLSSDVISVTTTNTGETWYGIVAFGVSGANTASPFDASAALPSAQSNNANCKGYPCDTGVSTSNANDFVFQLGGDTGSKLQTAGAGMTLILSSKSGQDVYAQYELTSATLQSATLSFGASQGSDFAVIADAIVSSSSASSYIAHVEGPSVSPGASSLTASPNSPAVGGSNRVLLAGGASVAFVLFVCFAILSETSLGKGNNLLGGPKGRNRAVRPNRRAT